MRPRMKLTSPLKALAEPTRLKMLLMLEAKPRTVGEIAGFFNLTQPTITRHLQALLKAGLVKREKKAQNVYYQIDTSNFQDFCIELVACFPCCCVTVKPTEKAASKRSHVQGADSAESNRKPKLVIGGKS